VKGVLMPSVESTNKKERLSFFVNPELSDKINDISKQTNLTISEIGRKALQNFIDLLEKEKIENELEAGYKANYQYYLKSNEDWKYADKE
jgi:predicted transcriptional regulator